MDTVRTALLLVILALCVTVYCLLSSQQTNPADRLLLFKQPTSYHCSIVKSVDIAGGPTKGRNVVLFFPDNNGVSLVVVGDARVDHLTLIKESVLQGGHPMIAYTVGLLSVASFVCPEGDATTSQEILRLQERSSDYLEWFKRTPVCQKLEKELRGNVPTTKVV